MIQPCEQTRGNYFHIGSLAILVLSTVFALINSLEVVASGSLVPLITLGGAIALIFLLTFLMMVRVKNSPSVHAHAGGSWQSQCRVSARAEIPV